MDEQTNQDTDARPRVFKSINGWIAGATGIVVALGGLATAYREFIHKDPVEAAAANAAPVSNAEQPAQAADHEDPWGYTTDHGGALRFKGGLWIETDAEGAEQRYTPESVENGFTYASDKGAGPDGEDVYLRWQTAGGQAEKSLDRQQTWNDAYTVTPEEDATAN